MTTVFISYRRDDAAAYAGRLYDGLRERYGDEHVFMDVDRIQPGENFAAVIERSVRAADVVLVVIGERWLTISNEAGQRRLDDPEDFVRLEVKAALDSGRRVIPVLVAGAGMPAESLLPLELQRLAGVQAVSMSDERWDYDSERLTRSIDGSAGPHTRRRWYGAAAVLALAAIALAAYLALPRATAPQASTVTLRAGPAVVSAEQARAMVIKHNFFHVRWNAAGATPASGLERLVLGTDIVIKDTRHQLMWQHGVLPRSLDHDGARQYVRELNTRRYAGHSDWRLPTLEETMSLMGTGAAADCHLHKLFDRAGPITRTTDTTDGGKDWVVYFCDGIAAPEVPRFNAQVRAVRSLP